MIDRDQLREAMTASTYSTLTVEQWDTIWEAARLVADPDTLVITKDDVEQAVRTNPTQWTRWPEWALEILIPWGAAENSDYHPHAILDDLLAAQSEEGT